MAIKGKELIEILEKIAEKIELNKAYLSELDATIGDGDHGINMSKGFKAVVEKLKDDNGEDVSLILKKAGMALVSTVGGASGPLYGTAFMKASIAVNGKSEIDINDFKNIIYEALEGIKMRGKATCGEKTMIDSINPAFEALKNGIENNLDTIEIVKSMKEAAFEGLEYTKTIVATKGRASYLGERSIGHQDAGATSSYLMIETIYENFK